MNVSEKGIDLIKNFEGCRLEGYKCPAGVPTIGYGHTGSEVHVGTKITQTEADRLLKNDLIVHCNNVSKLVKVPLNQNQFDALVSLEYNIGYGNFSTSTLLRLLNSKDYKGAARRFLFENNNAKTPEEKYKGCFVFDNKKKVLAGLVRRRKAEQDLFLQ